MELLKSAKPKKWEYFTKSQFKNSIRPDSADKN